MVLVSTSQGHVVLVFAIGTWDSKLYSFDTVLQGYILLLEQLLENESAQINGFVIIENFKHYSMAQAFALRPADLKKMVDMLQVGCNLHIWVWRTSYLFYNSKKNFCACIKILRNIFLTLLCVQLCPGLGWRKSEQCTLMNQSNKKEKQ